MDYNGIKQALPGKGIIANAVMKDGDYRKIIPTFVKAGLEPVSPSQLMNMRNSAVGDTHDTLWGTEIYTGFGVAADSEKVYLFPHSKHLRDVTPDTKLVYGGIPLKSKTDFDDAIIIPRSELGGYLNKSFPRNVFANSPIRTLVWLPHLAQGDEQRMSTYESNAFELGKPEFNYDVMLGLYVPDDDKPILRALSFAGIDGQAVAHGYAYMDDIYARLVGVPSGVALEGRAPGSNLEEKVK